MTPLAHEEIQEVGHGGRPELQAALDTWGTVQFAFESTDSPDVVVAS